MTSFPLERCVHSKEKLPDSIEASQERHVNDLVEDSRIKDLFGYSVNEEQDNGGRREESINNNNNTNFTNDELYQLVPNERLDRSPRPSHQGIGEFVRSSGIPRVRAFQYGGERRYRGRKRDWCKFSARWPFRISNRRDYRRALTGRVSALIEHTWCRRITGESGGVEQLLFRAPAKSGSTRCVTHEPPRSCVGGVLSNTGGTTRKRRVGISENYYAAGSDCEFGGLSVCEVVQSFELLLRERSKVDESSRLPINGVTMKTKNSSKRQESADDTVDAATEANEKYDEFDAIKMPVMGRGLSKSPQSDEGIETDTERRRGSVTRCWSLDSTVPSDDDASSLNAHQQRRHRLRISRCCSSDSAVLSDDDQVKGWENLNMVEGGEYESTEGKPRYWRTPSVVVSDYSDYSYLDERLERCDIDIERYERSSGSPSPSQASSCSCLDCDEIRESLDNQFLQVCRHRRHSDSCCLCLSSANATTLRELNETGNRRNSCLDTTEPYYNNLSSENVESSGNSSNDLTDKSSVDFLNIPTRKISDCSTNSSLSGDECDVSDLQPVKPSLTSGWRKLRNIVHWTPFFQTYKKQRYPWVQLAGHQGNFRAGPTPGTILKKLCPQEEACFRLLMNDVLRPYVPEFKGVLDIRETDDGNANGTKSTEKDVECNANENKGTTVSSYLQLQDLLGDFEQPCVMDCKVGVRTYLESELAKAKERPKLRKDMYEKMMQVDPNAPTTEERRLQGVTKPRYMVWRETISSTATLGFRVEGIKLAHGGSSKDFKTTRTREQVTDALRRFVEGYPHATIKYLQRLKAIRAMLKASPFFASHEVVGSSLLFVHDAKNAGVWMIDFAKTLPLPQHLPRIRHDAEWHVGNHEDGYLIGVNHLIDIFEDIRNSET